MKVGIFGSEYQIERQNLIKRLFEKLREQEADIYVDSPFYTFLTDAFGFEPVVSGLLVGDEFDLDIALSVGGDGTFLRTAARVNKQDIPILGINTGRLGFLADVSSNEVEDTLDEIFKNYYKVEERTLLRLYTEDRAFRGARARIPLLHRAAQEPFYAGHDVAVLRAAGCRADERGGGLAAALRRFYVVRQAQFEQQDQYLPRHARGMDGRRAGRALLYDPCRPFPAQHGEVAGRDAGRRGARAL